MRYAIALSSLIISSLAVPAAFAQSSGTTVAKDGSCPTSSGKVAIAKIGSCPTGFKSSANYCVGDKGDYAEIRSGSCSSGLKTSGKYCVK